MYDFLIDIVPREEARLGREEEYGRSMVPSEQMNMYMQHQAGAGARPLGLPYPHADGAQLPYPPPGMGVPTYLPVQEHTGVERDAGMAERGSGQALERHHGAGQASAVPGMPYRQMGEGAEGRGGLAGSLRDQGWPNGGMGTGAPSSNQPASSGSAAAASGPQ